MESVQSMNKKKKRKKKKKKTGARKKKGEEGREEDEGEEGGVGQGRDTCSVREGEREGSVCVCVCVYDGNSCFKKKKRGGLFGGRREHLRFLFGQFR